MEKAGGRCVLTGRSGIWKWQNKKGEDCKADESPLRATRRQIPDTLFCCSIAHNQEIPYIKKLSLVESVYLERPLDA